MDNDQATQMGDDEFITTLKRLRAYAETQAQQSFQAGDRRLFDLWERRAMNLGNVTAFESLRRKG